MWEGLGVSVEEKPVSWIAPSFQSQLYVTCSRKEDPSCDTMHSFIGDTPPVR